MTQPGARLEASHAGGRSLPPGVFVRDGGAWSEVTPLASGAFRVRLGGPFRPAWMASLASGLAGRRISIDQVHAKRAHDGSWVAELSLVPVAGGADPIGVPYIGLASEPPQPVAGSCVPALDTYDLKASSDYGGTLVLRFEAQDSLGLLGSLFCALASQGLYPIEMHIETRGGRAQDCLWLTADGAAAPSENARRALEQLLTASLTRV